MTVTKFIRVVAPHQRRPRRPNGGATKDKKKASKQKTTQDDSSHSSPSSETRKDSPIEEVIRPPRLTTSSTLEVETIDPFSALPIDLSAKEQQLLPFFAEACNFSVLPADLSKTELAFAYQWTTHAVNKPLLLTITCLHAAVFQDIVFRGQGLSPTSLKFLSSTLSSVQKGLDTERVPSSETLSAVNTLVSMSLMTGEIQHIGVHSKALGRIIKLRGGFEALDEYDGLLRMSINWVYPLAQMVAHLTDPETKTMSVPGAKRTARELDPVAILEEQFQECNRICGWLAAAEHDSDLKLSLLLTFSNVCGNFERSVHGVWSGVASDETVGFPGYELQQALCMCLSLFSLNRLRKLPMLFLTSRLLIAQITKVLICLRDGLETHSASSQTLTAIMWCAIVILHPSPELTDPTALVYWIDKIDEELSSRFDANRGEYGTSRYNLDAWPWDAYLHTSPLMSFPSQRSKATLSDSWRNVRAVRVMEVSESPSNSFHSELPTR